MLDKLVGNAVDFSYPEKKIYIKLFSESNKIILQVINYGPRLSQDMTGQLFNSMVSVRDKRTNVGPHLGLGLFIARLIAEFHGGIISLPPHFLNSSINLANLVAVILYLNGCAITAIPPAVLIRFIVSLSFGHSIET